MTDTIIQNEKEITIVQVVEDNKVYNIDQVTNIIETPSETIVVYDDTPSIIVDYVGPQGPPGPTAGPDEQVTFLPYIGQGNPSTKTTTTTYDNMIFERFDVGDELFLEWIVPEGADFNAIRHGYFQGNFFPTVASDGTYTASWEVHITICDCEINEKRTYTLYYTDMPLSELAYGLSLGSAPIDGSYFTANSKAVHIRLKRVASTNDPQYVGVNAIRIRWPSDGLVGEQGPTGPQGPAGGEDVPLSKQVDFVDETHIYIGEANPGTTLSAAAWRIKYVVLASDDDVSITWASGNDSFDKVWDNRASYSYS